MSGVPHEPAGAVLAPFAVAGRTAVVTGAASGIGRAIALRLAAAGARVALADVDEPELERAGAEARAAGAEAICVPTDVGDAEAVERLRERTLEAFGGVHLLVNNAGVVVGGRFMDQSQATWEWVLDVNLWGVVHGLRAFLPDLLAADAGHVVNTASMAGLITQGIAAPYAASKFAVVALSETLHHDLRAQGANVGVTVLCPGFVRTRIMSSDRHRPELAGAPDAGFARAATLVERGMAPERVAEQVLEAVASRRFYLFTEADGWMDLVGRRHRAIEAAGEPPGAGSFLDAAAGGGRAS